MTDPLVIGGTGVTSTLTLRSTSGVGAAGADIVLGTAAFQVQGTTGGDVASFTDGTRKVGIFIDSTRAALIVSTNHALEYATNNTVRGGFDAGGTFFTGSILPGTGLAGAIRPVGIAFARLGTPDNGTMTYCSDCTIADPCASGGTGAVAKRLNAVWVCN